MRVVICGGGTAGHIHPAVALADELRVEVPEIEILFIGTSQGLEKELIPEAGYSLKTISAEGFEHKLKIKNLKALVALARGCIEARRILKSFHPQVAIGMGGYASAPPIIMATLQKIPTLIHEQNAIPGLANKILSWVVNVIAISFPDTETHFSKGKRVVFTGNPIRRKVIRTIQQEGLSTFDLDPERKTLLVFGGSLGARSINYALVQAYEDFKNFENIQILHITGSRDFEDVQKEMKEIINPEDKVLYQCYPYLANINQAYAAADLVLCRAGATTIAEITAVGVPAILIPYPFAASEHQEKNARSLEKHGAARVLLDKNLSGQTLFNHTTSLLFNPNALQKMRERSRKLGRPFAANDLAKLVVEIAQSYRRR